MRLATYTEYFALSFKIVVKILTTEMPCLVSDGVAWDFNIKWYIKEDQKYEQTPNTQEKLEINYGQGLHGNFTVKSADKKSARKSKPNSQQRTPFSEVSVMFMS